MEDDSGSNNFRPKPAPNINTSKLHEYENKEKNIIIIQNLNT
jgi:hypothetical protein